MYQTFEEIKTLGEKLTGLEIRRVFSRCDGTFGRDLNGKLYIEIGTEKLPPKQIPFSLHSRRDFSRTYLLLQILLHEVAHYKQFLRFQTHTEFLLAYNENPYSFERVADRYALIYYRRFV